MVWFPYVENTLRIVPLESRQGYNGVLDFHRNLAVPPGRTRVGGIVAEKAKQEHRLQGSNRTMNHMLI